MNKDNFPIFAILFSVLVIYVSFTGCEGNVNVSNQQTPVPDKMKLDNTSEYHNQHYKVYTLEGCEYIRVDSGRSTWGSHKGNCKNPIHNDTQNGSN